MKLSTLRRAALLPSALALLLAASACAPSSAPAGTATSPSAPSTSDAHGIDAGAAAEVATPALALAIADRDGEVTLLDLASEERSTLAVADSDVTGVFGDGRLVFRAHADGDGASVEVIDSARWTMPHGDHTHSFRGEPRSLGRIEGNGEVRATTSGQRTTVAFAGGDLVLLAHDDLGETVDATPRLVVDASGPVMPFADRLLVPTAGSSIEIFDLSGDPAPGEGAACTGASDADTTRVGAVFTCDSGAVLFTREVGGALAAEPIPFPVEAPPSTTLSGRADRPDLAGVAGEVGAWLLDVRERRWTLLRSEVPLIRAVALGDDGSRTAALDIDGRVRVLAPDGEVLVRTEPLLAASVADPDLRDRVQLVVDARHAYLTDPASGSVHEIDHRDGRVARTFTDLDPWFVQQVG